MFLNEEQALASKSDMSDKRHSPFLSSCTYRTHRFVCVCLALGVPPLLYLELIIPGASISDLMQFLWDEGRELGLFDMREYPRSWV